MAVESAAPPAEPQSPGRRLRRAAAATVGTQALALALNVATGILVARLLGTTGRGELTAVLATTLLLTTLFSAGAATAAPYHQASRPEDAARLVATWLALSVALAAVAVLAGQLILPAVLAAQSDATIDLARLYLLSAFVLIAVDAVYGVALGAQRFGLYNAARLAGPALTALGYVVIETTAGLTVERALVLAAVINVATLVAGCAWAWRRFGFARPAKPLARTTLSYGIRAHATTVAERANAHLDLFILPAFLAAASVGLYAVAGSVAYVVAVLSSALATVVLPIATGDPERRERTVLAALRAALGFGAALALVLWLAAPALVEALYGEAFEGSVEPMRILLPGSVLYGGTLVIAAGLNAAGRPATAAAAQIAGAVVTVGGLLVFLGDGGIRAAAIVSTCAYATAFTVALVAYRSVGGFGWREVLGR